MDLYSQLLPMQPYILNHSYTGEEMTFCKCESSPTFPRCNKNPDYCSRLELNEDIFETQVDFE